MNKKGSAPKTTNTIYDYHTKCRSHQVSATNDQEFGLTTPYYIYSHDKVPIELANKRQKTFERRGVGKVYNAMLA
jgi:hypothetical protein